MKATLTDLGGSYSFNPTAKTITLSGLPTTITTSQLLLINNTTRNTIIYQFNNPALGGSIASNVITLTYNTTSMNALDSLIIFLDVPTLAYDTTLDVSKTINQSPDRSSYVVDTLVNTTNLAAATAYYPSTLGMSMDGFKDLCLSGRLIDADGTVTLTLEAANNPDPAAAVWHQIYSYSPETNTIVNTITVTNGTVTYVLCNENLNCTWFRVKLVTSGATNTASIFARRKSL